MKIKIISLFVVLALGISLGACGGGTKTVTQTVPQTAPQTQQAPSTTTQTGWGPNQEQQFLGGCESKAPAAKCQCLLTYLEQNYTVQQALALPVGQLQQVVNASGCATQTQS